ncbi:MAG: GDP-mannose 4,6-dehydratase, partial [Promethearchaeota archaeon]
MENVLITGANGFLGSHLTDLCISKGHEVHALVRPNQSINNLAQYSKGKSTFIREKKLEAFNENIQIPTNNEKLTVLECDIKNRVLLEKIIKKVKPRFIFHFAAQPHVIPSWEDPVDTIETNVIGTINVFEIIKKYDIKTRVIVACSSAEYGT